MSADIGRAEVYAAELAAFDGTSYEQVVDLTELTALAEQITGAPWWPHGNVPIESARGDACSSRTMQRGDASRIRLAAPQRTQATLIHELAHVLAGVGTGHGPTFRRAYVDLAAAAFGAAEAGWLHDAFAAAGLALGDRGWDAPPISGAIAL